MRIDAHHHIWDLAARRYPWLEPAEVAPLNRTLGLADLRPVAAAAGVTRTVVVQTLPDVAETASLLDVAAANADLVAGVVGWVDLQSPRLGADLDALRGRPGGDRLVGIRAMAQDLADPGWLARPDVGAALRLLGERDLAFDILVRWGQLPAAVTAVRSCPNTRFVLDHLGKPPIATGALEPWLRAIAALGELPNVACKLSGMVTEADPAHWSLADLRPFGAAVLAHFGPARLMFGSDWPVCTLAASYAQVVEVAEQLTAALSDAERDRFWAGTATEFYRLAGTGGRAEPRTATGPGRA